MVSGFMAPRSMLLKPPERVITSWVNAARILVETPSGPRVFGLLHSKVRKTMKPITVSNAEPQTVRRVWVDHVPGVRHSRASSNSTGKPIAPTKTPSDSGTQIHQSLTNPTRLFEYSEKPALLNACTAWNTASQTAWPNE